MEKRCIIIVATLVVLLSALMVLPATAQLSDDVLTHIPSDLTTPSVTLRPLDERAANVPDVTGMIGTCRHLFFSTEEEFVTRGPEPPDGNPIISDGDLLGPNCVVFARNEELLAAFKVKEDLGLDAADVIDVKRRLVAFSTELDDPRGRFTAGDLLVTNGAMIPNNALLANFDIPRMDLGLDAVHFVGDRERIIKFLDEAKDRQDEWQKDPSMLIMILKEYDIDIWFSTEGTGPVIEKPFIDGDLLSAREGIIVAHNALLLPVSVPAGIPDRGVDFGLDAVTTNRDGDKRLIHFSTEILYKKRPTFTDGDVLLFGNGVVCTNDDLIKCFEPMTDELGLDALSVAIQEEEGVIPYITHFNGVSVGKISPSGLAKPTEEPFGQPFGRWIQIQGYTPDDVDEYRVVYCKAEDWPCAETDIDGIEVHSTDDWYVDEEDSWWSPCTANTRHWYSTAEGWFDASDYRDLKSCNPSLPLTMWQSNAAPDQNGLYVVWLQYRRGGMEYEEPYKHYIQLDNLEPKNCTIAPKDGSFCDDLASDKMPLMVQGHFDDAHFRWYRLELLGGDPPVTKYYGAVNYYDSPTDGVGPEGTGPGMVDLYEVDVNNLPKESIDDCCYAVILDTWDRTIYGTFNAPNDYRSTHYGGFRNRTAAFTFAYTP